MKNILITEFMNEDSVNLLKKNFNKVFLIIYKIFELFSL